MSVRPAGDSAGASSGARALARRLAALEEGPIRAGAAARALGREDPERGALVVSALARDPGAEARVAMAAIAQALASPGEDLPYSWLAGLYAEGARLGLAEVTSLLVAPRPVRAFEEPRDRTDARLAHLTLGHKKAAARGNRDPDLLARLAAEGEPAVVRELLRNAQMTEDFVVRIAARRSCRPQTLRCVYESRRWRTRTAVALALVRNPWVETEIALKLVPALGAGELRDVAADGALHPLVRALAARVAGERGG